MHRYSLLAVYALLSTPCLGESLPPTAEGAYAIVHKDGGVTSKHFRITRMEDGWHLLDRKEDGTWSDVSCSRGCRLKEARPDQTQRYLGHADDSSSACIHNAAFAFCSDNSVSMDTQYTLIILTKGPPIPIQLKRLND